MSDLKPDPELPAAIGAIATLHGEFLLRSGQTAQIYFDKYRFETDPVLLRRIATAMVALLPEDVEIVAGLELGGVPLATAISLETGLPAAFIRKEAKTYGTCQAIEGRAIAGRRIVLIEDVITTGGAVVDAARLVHAAGGEIIAVVCAVWRGDGSPAIAGLPDIPVLAAVTKDELLGP